MKTVLTILMLVPIFPKLSETFILNQITGLISRGHRVFIQAKIPGDITKMHSTVAKYDLINKTYYNTWPDMNSIDIVIAQTGMRGADFVAIKDVLGFKGKLVTFFRGVDVSRALCSHQKDTQIYLKRVICFYRFVIFLENDLLCMDVIYKK